MTQYTPKPVVISLTASGQGFSGSYYSCGKIYVCTVKIGEKGRPLVDIWEGARMSNRNATFDEMLAIHHYIKGMKASSKSGIG